MKLAIEEAWKYQGLTFPNPSVGAAVVKHGMLVSLAAHQVAGDPHAEVLAIKEAYLKLSDDEQKKEKLLTLSTSSEIHEFLYENHDELFAECEIFSTLEPCNHFGKTPPCAMLVEKLKFSRAIFGSSDLGDSSGGGGSRLEDLGIYVERGFMEEECDLLLEPFVRWSGGQFIFFKLAQTLNGAVSPGKISCDESFELTHKIRDKLDLIIVGGNTVRMDRPTLDARLVGGKAPDVMILSRGDDFDRTIPLFAIPDRKVFVSSKLEIPQEYRFIMIEGGPNMLDVARDVATHFLIFVAPRIMEGSALSVKSINFDYLSTFRSGRDIAIWAKRSNS